MRRLTSWESPGDGRGGEGGLVSLFKKKIFCFLLEALINFLDRQPCLHGAQRVDQMSSA